MSIQALDAYEASMGADPSGKQGEFGDQPQGTSPFNDDIRLTTESFQPKD